MSNHEVALENIEYTDSLVYNYEINLQETGSSEELPISW